MVEDQSTNGTIVDDHLLTSHPQAKGRSDPPISKWVLSSGSIIKIYLHKEARDLTFRSTISSHAMGYHARMRPSRLDRAATLISSNNLPRLISREKRPMR
ncbi:hypothetical protein LB505_002861 [Fusarium chuoi]|nr:hypothetical protein LB505_002861 [Fusarium chuoi]